jgi:hypothetical protein
MKMTKAEWRAQERREAERRRDEHAMRHPNRANLERGIGCKRCGAQGPHDFCELPWYWFR